MNGPFTSRDRHWRAIGFRAGRSGRPVRAVLTESETVNAHIRAGYAAGRRMRARLRAQGEAPATKTTENDA